MKWKTVSDALESLESLETMKNSKLARAKKQQVLESLLKSARDFGDPFAVMRILLPKVESSFANCDNTLFSSVRFIVWHLGDIAVKLQPWWIVILSSLWNPRVGQTWWIWSSMFMTLDCFSFLRFCAIRNLACRLHCHQIATMADCYPS